MANYHRIAWRFWADVDVRGWSDQAKLLALYLLTCRHRSMEGLYLLPPEYAGADLKWPTGKVRDGLGELERAGFVLVDEDAQVVLVRNALKYQAPSGEKQIAGAVAAISPLPDTPLLGELIRIARDVAPELAGALQKRYPAAAAEPRYPFDTQSNPETRGVAGADTRPIGDPELAPSSSSSSSSSSSGDNDDVEPERLDQSEAAQQVFDTWITATGRTGRTRFDEKRRRIVRRALRDFPLQDVLDAVQGWQHSAHHRGENNSSTTFNDLELLLRDSAHIEKFRDLQRQHGDRADSPAFIAQHPCADDPAVIDGWQEVLRHLPTSEQTFLADSHPHHGENGHRVIGVRPGSLGWLRSRARNQIWLDRHFDGRPVEFIECPSLGERNAA